MFCSVLMDTTLNIVSEFAIRMVTVEFVKLYARFCSVLFCSVLYTVKLTV